MTHEASDERLMHRLVAGRVLVLAPAVFGDERMQLGPHVAPLAHAQPGKEMRPAPLPLLVRRLVPLELAPGSPQVEVPIEFRLRLALAPAKERMLLVGLGELLGRALARILHRQRRREHQHLGQASVLPPGREQAPDLGIERQRRERSPHFGERAGGRIERRELHQLAHPVLDRTRRRRIEKGEPLDLTQIERLHA